MTSQTSFVFAVALIALLAPAALAGDIFDGPVSYDVGVFPVGVLIGDLDGDGAADVATANSISQDISIRFGAGDGSLGPETRLGSGAGDPRQLAVGDLDGDGDPDLVAAIRGGTGSVAVLLNEGGGHFAEPVQLGAPGMTFAFEVVDLDGDDDLDVVVLVGFIEVLVEVLLNDGTGAFSSVGVHTAMAPDFTYIADLSVGDIDGDGRPDLAVVAVTSGEVVTFTNLGGGDLAGPVPVDVDVTQPSAVLLHDLDADGTADLVIVDGCLGDDEVVVLLNDGAGGFGPGNATHVGSLCHSFTNPFALEAGDLDADGADDLVVVSRNDDEARVLLNLGGGTLAAPLDIPVDNEPLAAALGDLDGDGRVDIVTANLGAIPGNGSVSVLLNVGSTPCPADIDGDGAVGVADLLELLAVWGACAGCPADVDADGAVGISDLLLLLAAWGPCA